MKVKILYQEINTGYALFNTKEGVTVNLKEGWSDDGLGSRDTLIGVTTVHSSSYDDIVYGTDAKEKVFRKWWK